jgi:hypothetical protein
MKSVPPRTQSQHRATRLSGYVSLPILGSALFLASVQSACGGTPSQTAADQRKSAKTPEELNALFHRETEIPASKSTAASDGSWRAEFPTTTEVTVEPTDGYSQITFSLGTEVPAQCFFYNDTIDTGQSVTKMLSHLRKNIEFTHVAPYRISTALGLPIVFVEGRYLADSPAGKVAGSIKLAISPRFNTPFLCFLDLDTPRRLRLPLPPWPRRSRSRKNRLPHVSRRCGLLS